MIELDLTHAQHIQLRRSVVFLTEAINIGHYRPFTLAEAQREHSLGQRNIVGFGYGVKLVGGQPVDRVAVTGYVVRKAPKVAIEPRFEIDGFIRRTLGGLPEDVATDVIEVANPAAYHSLNTARFTRRIPGGAGVSNTLGKITGTIGGWVRTPHNEIMFLSCWHVLDGGRAHVGSSISQPDGNRIIGSLVASVGPTFSVASTTVDAALATLNPNLRDAYGDFILQVGEIRGTTDVTKVKWPVHVRKYGIGTGLSNGAIVQASASLPILLSNQSTLFYAHQLIVQPDQPGQPFVLPGDSGALLVTDDNLVIGLVVGGISSISMNGSAIATPISAVLSGLGSKLGNTVDFLTYP